MTNRTVLALILFLVSPSLAVATPQAPLPDESTPLGHRITLSFQAPVTSETASKNPFTDYRLLVTLTQGTDSKTVRGFFAADGNAANTSATKGQIWKVHFLPPKSGRWTWNAELRTGPDIAISQDPAAGQPVDIDRTEGEFVVAANSPSEDSVNFYDRGLLTVDNGFFRFHSSGDYWIKGGTNSPENLLAYVDFDGTYRVQAAARDGEAAPPSEIHRYAAHAKDWQAGDPTWKNGKGKSLIGAINYLASTGMNTAYFLTMNIGGDGNDVWPYLDERQLERFDCSKLDQWDIVFQHMQRKGILLHMVTQETENEKLLDDGETGRLRKLYYSELIARFAAHPGLVWNLGEENGPAHFSPNGQTSVQQRQMATVLKELDPYDHPVVIHTHSTDSSKDELLPALLKHQPLDGLSLQVDRPAQVNSEIIKWKQKAAASGHPWLICMDEIGKWDTGLVPDSVDAKHDELRRLVLWGSLMAGAGGVEWYFGAHYPQNDLNSEDWRQRDAMWKQTHHALKFFRTIPFWNMVPANDLVSGEGVYCLAETGKQFVVYVPAVTKTVQVDLGELKGTVTIKWYNPRTGEFRKHKESLKIQNHNRAFRIQVPAPGDWVAVMEVS